MTQVPAATLLGVVAPSGAEELSEEELAKKTQNPVASLISLPLQFNYDRQIGADDEGERFTLNVQPVIPIRLNDKWNLISRTIAPIIYGTIGYSAGIEFTSYVKVYEELPDVAAIYEGRYPVIDNQPALLYALVSALVEYFDGSQQHKEHLFAFSESLPTEFGVMLVKDVIVKDESLAMHGAFDGWLAKYGDYII